MSGVSNFFFTLVEKECLLLFGNFFFRGGCKKGLFYLLHVELLCTHLGSLHSDCEGSVSFFLHDFVIALKYMYASSIMNVLPIPKTRATNSHA